MSECPIHRVELLLGRCWMCRGVPPGGTPNRPPWDEKRTCSECGNATFVRNEQGRCRSCSSPGAASRSERGEDSGNGPKAPTCTNNSPAGWTEHWREWHRGHGCEKDPSAAEAAQSPQVGAAGGPPCYCCNGTGSVPRHGAPSARALEESLFLISQWTLRHEALRMAAEKVRKVFRGGPTVRSYTGEEGAALAELEDLLASNARNEFYDTDHRERVLAIAAEPGRSISDRPPARRIREIGNAPAEAAQSPQVGAARAESEGLGTAVPRPLRELRLEVRRTSFRFSEEKPDGKPRRLYLSLDERDGDPKGFGMALGRVFRHRDRVTLIRTAELEALRSGRAQPAAGPPVNPPVASADPELAKLLREAHDLLRFWPSDAGWRPDPSLMSRIDSALSRLAGQSATANENASGGAARGSPEEDR
jgi:hypothetical protein